MFIYKSLRFNTS